MPCVLMIVPIELNYKNERRMMTTGYSNLLDTDKMTTLSQKGIMKTTKAFYKMQK